MIVSACCAGLSGDCCPCASLHTMIVSACCPGLSGDCCPCTSLHTMIVSADLRHNKATLQWSCYVTFVNNCTYTVWLLLGRSHTEYHRNYLRVVTVVIVLDDVIKAVWEDSNHIVRQMNAKKLRSEWKQMVCNFIKKLYKILNKC